MPASRRAIVTVLCLLALALTAPPAVADPCGASTTYSNSVINDGATHYWRLSDTNATMCALRGSHGTFKSSYASMTPGALIDTEDPRAIAFGTNGRGVVADTSTLNPLGAITLEAWVKPTGALGRTRTILAKDEQYFLRINSSNLLQFRVWVGDPNYLGSVPEEIDSVKPEKLPWDTWSHVAATYKMFSGGREEMRLYINGEEVKSRIFDDPNAPSWTKGLAVPSTRSSFFVGARGDYWDPFEGPIDEAAVYYEKALTRQQLGDHVSAGRGLPQTTITSGPPATQAPTPTSTSLSSATFGFTATNSPTSYQCRLDQADRRDPAGAWQSCTSAKTYTGLPSGSHRFEVRAFNSRGVDPTPARQTWTISGCAPAFGAFDVGRWPSSCWRPYAATSPFNKLLPASPRLHSQSAQIVAKLMTFCESGLYQTNSCAQDTNGAGKPGKLVAGFADTGEDYSHPIYYSKSTDPYVTLTCDYAGMWGDCGGLNGARIQVPAAARPAGWTSTTTTDDDPTGDHHMAIVDQAAGIEYDLYKIRLRSATEIAFRYGGKLPINGDGRGGYAVAAEWGLLAGVIREQELRSGAINHALNMTVLCSSGAPGVYPSLGGDGRSCDDLGQSTTNAPTIGMHFQLNMTETEINGLALPDWKKTILKAMAKYGMFVGDTGGSAWGVQLESGSTYTSFGYEDRMWLFAQDNGWLEDDHSARVNGATQTFATLVANLGESIAWGAKLRVIDPCVSQGTC